jgi:hypothetical protein
MKSTLIGPIPILRRRGMVGRVKPLMAGIGLALLSVQAWAAGSFDGNWSVVVFCPDDPGPNGALHYTYTFPATVAGGVLHGEHGSQGAPGWLLIEGAIQPDGSAQLNAKGLTGQPPENYRHVQGGTPYAYPISAHFDNGKGSGNRTDGRRACTATFTKQ